MINVGKKYDREDEQYNDSNFSAKRLISWILSENFVKNIRRHSFCQCYIGERKNKWSNVLISYNELLLFYT